MTVSHINPQASGLKGCWGLTCISLSGGRSIPTEECVLPSKLLMNSWSKSKFSWSKQLLVSNIQKKVSGKKRSNKRNQAEQNVALWYICKSVSEVKYNYTVGCEVPRQLARSIFMHTLSSMTFWYFYHTAIPTDTTLSPCTLDRGFHKYYKKCYSFHEKSS